ncbi:MAG: hypothetical protein JO005_10765 [Gammaproteobacteria bacterium]|nr:hypothetical protein [Gammaproteobacteria bacterium]
MTYSDETLMAYADGELDEAARGEIRAALEGDPELARRVAAHQALRARLREAFDPVLREGVPARLLGPLEAPARPKVYRLPLRPRVSVPQWGALAASVLLGLLLGSYLFRPASAPVRLEQGALLAQGALERALDTQLASRQADDVAVRIGVSFLSREGQYCRSFALKAPAALAGLACRGPGGWQVPVLESGSAGGNTYRTAASALTPGVQAAITARIRGEPLDAAGEAQALAEGFRAGPSPR